MLLFVSFGFAVFAVGCAVLVWMLLAAAAWIEKE